MNWFEGSIAESIRTVREHSRILLVFIRGTDEVSKVVDELFDEEVRNACDGLIALRLEASSEAVAQFSAVYALLTVPCIYLIAPTGQVLDVKLGTMQKSELIAWIADKRKQLSEAEVPSNDNTASNPEVTVPSTSAPSAIPPEPATVLNSTPTSQPDCDPEPSGSSQLLEERVKYAREVLEAKRRIQVEEERKKAIEGELSRRQTGKALQDFKERQRVLEIEEAMAERRRDEAEQRQLRERLRQQIEDDRRAKEERYRMTNPQNATGSAQPVSSILQAPVNPTSSTSHDQARLQLRLIEGGHVIMKFSPGATLTGDVRRWLNNLARNEPDGTDDFPPVEEKIRSRLLDLCTRGFRFRLLHPAKLFDPEEEAKSLADLGLCPSAVLVLIPTGGSNTFAVQPTTDGWLTQLLGLVQGGVSGVFGYVSWFVGGVYNFGVGLVSSIAPNRNTNPVTGPRNPPRPTAGTSHGDRGSSPTVNRAVRRQGNMARLSHLPDNSDDEQARWNGNSTEQL